MASEGVLGSLYGLCTFQTESFLNECHFVVLDTFLVDCVDYYVCRGTLAFLLALLLLLCRGKTENFIQLRQRAEGEVVSSLENRAGSHCFDYNFIYVERYSRS